MLGKKVLALDHRPDAGRPASSRLYFLWALAEAWLESVLICFSFEFPLPLSPDSTGDLAILFSCDP